MDFKTVIQQLQGDLIYQGDSYAEVTISSVIINDLMSEVLVIEQDEGVILLTSLLSEQVIRTADIIGLEGIVFLKNKRPPENMIKMAKESGMTLLSTPLDGFNACYILGKYINKNSDATD